MKTQILIPTSAIMDRVREIVLDYLEPGGPSAERAMDMLVAIADPGDRPTGSAWLRIETPANDNLAGN
jgi:hypothetical protein